MLTSYLTRQDATMSRLGKKREAIIIVLYGHFVQYKDQGMFLPPILQDKALLCNAMSRLGKKGKKS